MLFRVLGERALVFLCWATASALFLIAALAQSWLPLACAGVFSALVLVPALLAQRKT